MNEEIRYKSRAWATGTGIVITIPQHYIRDHNIQIRDKFDIKLIIKEKAEK